MRADSHYVDDLPPAAQPVIRMVPPTQIECCDLPPADSVETLTRSIGAHGVLQPLLVRRQGRGYALIAGRKRLAAAAAAGVAAVPCVLHDVDGQGAVALAEADNLRPDVASHTPSDLVDDVVRPVVRALLADLTTICASTTLMKVTERGSLTQQVGADLVDAHARRAAWLAGCVAGSFENDRLVPLAAIIQRVSDAFGARKTLAGMQLEWSVTPAAANWMLPEEQATAVITGGVFAALASLEGVPAPRIEIHAESPQPRTLRIEVVQRVARVRPSGSDLEPGQPADLAAALALQAARRLAASYAGTADLTPLPGQGSALQMTFAATS